MTRVALLALAASCALLPLGAHAQADPAKVLRVSLRSAETGFDPQAFSDLYSGYVVRAIFEPLYRYDYLARPHRIVPNTAVALPEGSKDGRVWTFRIRPGIYFADDPAFKGKKRELTAADYAYSWKRILDPRMRSPALELFDGKIVGMDKVLAKAKETGRFDYDAPVEGLQVLDRYTLKLTLNYPWWDILADLTSANASAVAREVVEAYGDASGWVMSHPVGTGPYRLKEWVRAQKIVLEANPVFRGIPFAESNDPADAAINARLRGKTFPRIGRVEVYVLEESQPRVLAFEKGDIDYLDIPTDLAPNMMQRDGTLLPRFAQAGVRNERGVQPSIVYAFFNMEDPVVGGYTKEKIALRRAIGMGYNAEEEISVIRQGQGQFANMLIPPGVTGYDPKLVANTRYDPAGAKALLDRYGYVDRDGDGWRDLPDGRPMVLKRGTSPSALERQYDELWARNMKEIGIRMEMVTQKWPDMLKMARGGQIQIWQLANTSTSTEGYGVLGLVYGPNKGLANLSRFALPEFDRLYDESRKLPDGPERARLVGEMSKIVAGYAPWKLTAYRIENIVVYPWVIGFKYNPFNQNPWAYLDIDLAVPRRAVQ
ncbi:MAG: ABC transporter substrate-binding protein [Burkholderiales bacterium]